MLISRVRTVCGFIGLCRAWKLRHQTLPDIGDQWVRCITRIGPVMLSYSIGK
jgi:hypothetical protein